MKEAVILAGGNSWRLKPDTWIPKPLLALNSKTLLSHQVHWLHKYGFNKIVITTTEEVFDKVEHPIVPNTKGDKEYVWSLEMSTLGTSGAVAKAFEHIDKKAYVLNVDDVILNYNPIELYNIANTYYSSILLAKPKIEFGRVERRQDLILNFKEKPYLDFYVSTGHYTFSKVTVDKYFRSFGDLEKIVLPKLSRERRLKNTRIRKNKWFTINNMRDYLNLKEVLQ